MEKRRSAGLWVSVLYFAEGFPYTVVNLMSVIFLKDLGASNELIGVTSLLYLPWVLKGLWGPLVDLHSTKRHWILSAEVVCTVLFILLALGVLTAQVLTISLTLFAVIAFVSATHDIAIDGFYLDALDKNRQALYVGVRSAAYKIAWLVGSGGLVFLAGYCAACSTSTTGWAIAFGSGGIIFLLIYLFQLWYLPYPTPFANGHNEITPKHNFLDAFKTYFTQGRMGWILTYILIFRLGDAFMLKMAPPFLMDTIEKGGLAISTAEIGILYGTVGVIFLLAGGIIGGFIIAKQGLKRWMWPFAFLQNGAIILYWFLAANKPSLAWVYAVNSFEQFSYGLGVSAYSVFLMRTVLPEYRASHYAITTAFMAAGVMVPGVFSGYLQAWIGYEKFFLMSFLVALPGLATIAFLPLKEKG
jgi:PAT family beta-lactamase induction signal transducer AmpG